jgi:hypothetical protein
LLAQKKRTKEKGSLKSFSKKDLGALIALRRFGLGYPLTKISVSPFGFQMASENFGRAER